VVVLAGVWVMKMEHYESITTILIGVLYKPALEIWSYGALFHAMMQPEGPHSMQVTCLWISQSLPHELSKLLFFINYTVSDIK
jgi:hypothetical protein